MNKHWTTESTEDFLYNIGADYVDTLSEHLEANAISRREFASRLSVSEGRVSQIFNAPGNLTLDTMASWARACGLKFGVVAYDDGDREGV